MDAVSCIITMIWLMMPANLSNPAATIVVALTGTGKPIDQGKYLGRQRIFGDGKTYKGFFFGIFFGIIVAFIQNLINMKLFNNSLPAFTIISLITLPMGALLGDLAASFFKRRFGMKRGQAFPLIDQLDFVFGSWALTYFFATDWFINNFSFCTILSALLLIPVFHLLFNFFGYKLGVKKEPW
jgi:CDP-2,3-bis-(O-geranylgeranyl)-sn-glycerol synthase